MNYYQKPIKNSSKIKKIFLKTRKSHSFDEIRGYFRRSLMSKLQNFLPLWPNHGGSLHVTKFRKIFKISPPHFLNSTALN